MRYDLFECDNVEKSRRKKLFLKKFRAKKILDSP